MVRKHFFDFTKKYIHHKKITKIEEEQKLSIGQRSADIVTAFVGSWKFIIITSIIIFFWIIANGYFIFIAWDPYPFILLNLTLSTLAALHTPIILMSQNRQSEIDRVKAEYDYQINLKAEKEIEDMQKDLEDIKKMIKELKR